MTSPPCPWCHGIMRQSKRTGSNDPVVSVRTAYEALSGLGWPEEQVCSPTQMKKLLVGKKITAVEVEVGTKPSRSILHSITLEDGRTLYLGSSPLGAVAYKVTHE